MFFRAGFASAPSILLNGSVLASGVRAEIREGEVMIPLGEALALVLDATIDIKIQDDRTIAVVDAFDRRLEFAAGQAVFYVDGQERPLPIAPYEEPGGVLIVPAVSFFEALDATVQWNSGRMQLMITKNIARKDVAGDLPQELLFGMAEATIIAAATETAPVPATSTEMPLSATATATSGTLTDAQLNALMEKGNAFQLSYDTVFAVDMDTVSGEEGLSYIMPATVFQNRFNIRAEKKLENGYVVKGSLNTMSTSDNLSKKGDIQKLNITAEKQGFYLGFYDVLPRFSNYVLKNYRLQGVEMRSTDKDVTLQIVSGKTPKQYRTSEYARYINAVQVKHGGEKKFLALNYVLTRDTGDTLASAKMANHVLALSGAGKYGKRMSWNAEYGRSDTRTLQTGYERDGGALNAQAKYLAGRTQFDMTAEMTSEEFYSETSFFTRGKHEYSVMSNTRVSNRLLIGIGHRNRLLKGNRSYIYPMLFSVKPVLSRPNMKLDIRQNYERTTGKSHTLIDNRQISFRDMFGDLDLSVNLGRRKTKNSSGVLSYRDTYDYRFQFPLSERDTLSFVVNREKLQNSSTPKTRMTRGKFTRAIGDWQDFNFTVERYYSNTSSDRYGFIVGYRGLNVETEREISIDYAYLNYRFHNENSLKVRYNIYK